MDELTFCIETIQFSLQSKLYKEFFLIHLFFLAVRAFTIKLLQFKIHKYCSTYGAMEILINELFLCFFSKLNKTF